ncbi:MAG: hypothetical protein ACAI44_12110 [Candidatus Sericytochromatia bacterium]
MRAARLLLTAILGLTSAGVAADRPHIARLHGEIRLWLPPPMQQALLARFPDFVPWRESDYMALIRRDYVNSWQQAPFAVIGDFNRDRRQDVAIMGHTAKESLLLVLLSQRTAYRVELVDRGPRVDPASSLYGWPPEPEAGRGLEIYLHYTPPGRYTSGYEKHPLHLRQAAFSEVFWGKAAGIYYWDSQGFHWFTTAD